MSTSDRVRFASEVAFCLLVLGMAVVLSINEMNTDREVVDAQTRWFKAHDCKRKGYLTGPYVAQPVYACDDGNEYIWADLPRAAS